MNTVPPNFTSIGSAAASVVDGLRAKMVERTGVERFVITNRADWLRIRHRDVTASEIGGLFGCHPYRSALQIFADKTGNGADRGDNPAMRRGRILESAVAAAVQEEHPDWKIEKANEYLRDPVARLGATPDWYVTDAQRGRGILETKTADPSVFERDWKDGVPLAWTLQCLVQMMLAGTAWGAVAVLVTSRDYPVFVYDVPRHAGAEAKIVAKVKALWDSIENGTAPAADFAKDGAAIAAMFPRETLATVDLSSDNRMPELLERRSQLGEILKAAEGEKDAIDAEIKQKIGEAAGATLPGWKLSWKSQDRVDTGAITEAWKAEGRTIPKKSHRVLRVTELKNRDQAA